MHVYIQNSMSTYTYGMYISSSLMYDHNLQQSMDQPDKVANPAGGQLNREENDFSLSPFAPKNLVSRDGFSRPIPRKPAYSPHRLNLLIVLLTHAIPPTFRGGVHLFIPPNTLSGQSRVQAIGCRWRSLPRGRRHRANSPQGSSRNRCCLFRDHHG